MNWSTDLVPSVLPRKSVLGSSVRSRNSHKTQEVQLVLNIKQHSKNIDSRIFNSLSGSGQILNHFNGPPKSRNLILLYSI